MNNDLKNKLPNYSPPDAVWAQITQQLDESALHEALGKLPMYEPKGESWHNIEARLDQHRLRWWYYAAACIGFPILAALFYLLINKSSENISYKEEKVKVFAIETIKNSKTEAKYAQVLAVCEQKATVCDKPQFKALKRQLDDLTAASKQLEEVIGAYNNDPHLNEQLLMIEKDKTAIIDQMIATL
jgi:hypothetical protein